MSRPTKIIVNSQNLLHNLELLKRWTGNHFFCPMVKANAYGHGAELVAKIIETHGKTDALGVALVEEGLQLRQQGMTMPIVAYGPLSRSMAQLAIENSITPVVGRSEDLEALISCKSAKPIKLHLKLNTGMQRIGFDENEMGWLKAYLHQYSAELQVEGVCTHLTHGEEILQVDGPSRQQIAKFLSMAEGLPGIRHVHKSATLAKVGPAGVSDFPFGARPGIGMYGLPHDGRDAGPGLKPVLQWQTELVRIHQLEKGQSVSYSARWKAMRRSVIGVLPLGYGDGYMRVLSNKGEMLFRGRRVPVVGSVCMDYIMVDLTESCQDGLPKGGESVVILGEQEGASVSAVDIAEKAGTIAYEVVTAISARVAREAV